MSEIKLLNCPFCGGEAYMDKFFESCDGRGDKLPKVKCKECGCDISLSYEEVWKLDDKFGYKGGYRSNNKELLDCMHKSVADKWNTRKPMERILERLKKERNFSYENFKDEEPFYRKGLRAAEQIIKIEGGIK